MSEMTTVPLADGDALDVYVARPEGPPIGGLVVIHEIWGLVDHIKDVADRFAAEGWLVAAPDLLSNSGVAPALGAELFGLVNGDDEEARTAAQPRMREAMSGMRAPEYARWAVGALRATVGWLMGEPGVGGRLAATGFCFGGTYAFLLAAHDDRVRAVAPFYGTAPSPGLMAGISAPVLALYGQHDPALIDALPAVTAAMAEAGVDFEAVVYPDSAHAFFNDTGRRYNPTDADDAWGRVTAFLRDNI
jgi:carboxymethylenebutenolidase